MIYLTSTKRGVLTLFNGKQAVASFPAKLNNFKSPELDEVIALCEVSEEQETKVAPRNAVAQILAQLNEAFAKYDAEHEENSVQWAKCRCEAIAKAKEEFASLRKNAFAYYGKLHEVAGGKTWFDIFRNGFNSQVEDFVRKNAKATCEKRNANIAKKLNEAGIIAVESSEVVFASGGFDGVFKVVTNDGAKRVTVNTIYAGGYNIQCLHNRTLIKVK